MKYLLTAILLPSLAAAAILPEAIGAYRRGAVSKPALANKALWEEYGLKSAETAPYQSGNDKFTATVWQLHDTTGSLAAFDWQTPPAATNSTAAKLAVETPDSLLMAHGNYLFLFAGYKPSKEELDGLTGALRNLDVTVLPTLPGYLPTDGIVPNSARYIVGPVGLQQFAPAIPPSVAAFHFQAEAQAAVFHNDKGDATLLVFSYPTHQIAMQRILEFQKVPGAMAKRSGPLVAVVLAPPDPDYAEKLLSKVRYQAEVTLDEYVPTRRDNIGNLVVNAFILIGFLLAFALVSGFALGGYRAFRRRYRHGDEEDAMISLNL